MPEENLKVKKIIAEMRKKGNLPALSENVGEISRLTNLLNTCAPQLASVIMRDCGLTANLLTTVNSTLYAPRHPVKTVSSAVTLLGFEKVRSLTLGMSIFRETMKSTQNQKMLTYYAGAYFSGSFAMALASENNYKNPEEIFIAGLLIRLPKLALANTFPKKFQQMEDLMSKEKLSQNNASERVFEVTYDEIRRGINEYYKIPGKVAEVLEQNKNTKEPTLALVQEAASISEMLFSEKKGGKNAISLSEKRLQELLKQKKFSLTDFIKKTCNSDANINKFFKLKEEDVDMMVNLLEWGKSNPSQVISKLAFDEVLAEEHAASRNQDPENLFGHFLTELTMCRRGENDINKIIMLSQEALYRCLTDTEIIIAFFNKAKKLLVGRFYAGSNLLINAEHFFISTNSDSAVIHAANDGKLGTWPEGDSKLGIPAMLIKRLKIKNAMFHPFKVFGTPIGVYFVSRQSDETFSEREQAWTEQIIEQVEEAFEKMRGQ